jgi:hypothetical protein
MNPNKSVNKNKEVVLRAVSCWIAVDNQSFSSCKTDMLQRILLEIANYTKNLIQSELPDRKVVQNAILMKREAISSWLVSVLQSWDWLSLTIDIWRSPNLR